MIKFFDLTEQDALTKLDDTVQEDELENYKGKWINLIYLKDGRRGYGHKMFDSEEEAFMAEMKNAERRKSRPQGRHKIKDTLSDGPILYIAHWHKLTLQMPIGDT